MKKHGVQILTAAACLAVLVAGIFYSIRFLLHDEGFFYRQHATLQTDVAMGISCQQLTQATMRLVDYMEGRVDDIDMTVEQNGQPVSMYNTRESMHMVDVRQLYQTWLAISRWCLVGAAAVFMLLAWRRTPWAVVARGLLQAGMVLVVFVAAAAIWMAVDFTSFWDVFHQLSFDNQLWLLNPATSRMINMLPEQLFFNCIVAVIVRFVVPWAGASALAGGYLAWRRWGKRAARQTQPHGGGQTPTNLAK